MRSLTVQQQAALAGRHVMRRLFIWCDALDENGDPDPAGFWDDVGDVSVDGRTYHGSGSVISVQTLSATSDLSIPGLQITASGIDPQAEALVRGHLIAQRPITVSIGIFDVDARVLLPPLLPLFGGAVDQVTIKTPESGGTATVELMCESASRALTRKSTDTRSHPSELQRSATDQFYAYTGVQREQTIYFGRPSPHGGSVPGNAGGGGR